MAGPTFLIIGAQKCGTTSLHSWLRTHPAVWMPARKEMHYFDLTAGYPRHTAYRATFPVHDGVSGEATPIYCFWPGAIKRIHEFDPTLKLLMLMRNPIDRAYSQWRMVTQCGYEDRTFIEAVAQEETRLRSRSELSWRRHSYIARGRYVEQLDRVMQLFPREQLHLAKLEDLADPEVLRGITEFLGVRAHGREFPHALRGDGRTLTGQFRGVLRLYFAAYNVALTNRYGVRTDDWE